MFAWAITAVMLGRSAVAVMVMTMAPLALVLLQFVIFSYLFRGKHRLDLSFGLGTAGFHLLATGCRKTPIPRSALDKNPMPGHLFKDNPVEEGTTRRGTDTLVHRPEKPADSKHSSTSCLSPRE